MKKTRLFLLFLIAANLSLAQTVLAAANNPWSEGLLKNLTQTS